MKLNVMTGPACLLLGACAIYPQQTASNSDVEVAVVGDVVADTAVTDTIAMTSEQVDYADDDRIICKRTIITGSRFKHKVCMSWFEWKEARLRSKEYVEGIQSVSTRLQSVPSGPSASSGLDVSPGD